MTTTNSTSGASSAAAQASASVSLSGNNKVTFDTFLKLLVAQLKNQDPLNPMEGTEFTSQIAQFSQLEQQINSNSYLQELLKQRDYGQQNLATSYIGKDVLVPGDRLVKAASGDVTLGYSLEKTATKVTVGISNADGTTVRTFSGDGSKGRHLVTWDGKDDAGNVLPAGAYKITVQAYDANGTKVTSEAYSMGRVDSVLNDGTDISLSILDGRQVGMDDVMSIQNPATH